MSNRKKKMEDVHQRLILEIAQLCTTSFNMRDKLQSDKWGPLSSTTILKLKLSHNINWHDGFLLRVFLKIL